MKVLHKVITNKNYIRYQKGKVLYCPELYYGKGLYENVVYLDFRRKDFISQKEKNDAEKRYGNERTRSDGDPRLGAEDWICPEKMCP